MTPLPSAIALSASALNSRLSKEASGSEICDGAWENPGVMI